MNIRQIIRKFGRIVIFCILILFISIGLYKIIMDYYRIRTIEVVGERVKVQIDPKSFPTNLLLFPAESYRAKILRDTNMLSDIRIEKKFPSTLVLHILRRIPVAGIEVNGRLFLLDIDGVVVDQVSNTLEYPRIVMPIDTIQIGMKFDAPRIIQSVKFIEYTKDILQIKNITEVEGSSLKIKTDTTDIFITQNGDIQSIVTTLQTLLSGFRIKGTLPAIIDLRYTKPIIKY
jgi:hypothetical protein